MKRSNTNNDVLFWFAHFISLSYSYIYQLFQIDFVECDHDLCFGIQTSNFCPARDIFGVFAKRCCKYKGGKGDLVFQNFTNTENMRILQFGQWVCLKGEDNQ